jgi:superfamily I DNA/RNA helicase
MYFLDKSIIYTAITRAKEKCVIIADARTFKIACKKTKNRERKTNMSTDIRIYSNKGELYDYAKFDQLDLDKILQGEEEKAY